MLDSGGSSQCDFGGGQVIRSSRLVNNYICVWLKSGQTGSDEKKEDKPVSVKTVCLDPGHGPGTVNGSPDGSYKEKEFTWDMYKRLRPLLEASGVKVISTRNENETPALLERAAVSNKAGADLFVSLHSNAFGFGDWDSARGLLIYTSAAGDSAGRNKAARAILARMAEAGVSLHGSGLAHNMEYTVLTATVAPAMIVEYGFHTNKEDAGLLKQSAYRDKLALATAQGVCDYLGITQPVTPPAPDPTAPWYAADQEWAKARGITDGARPEDTCTRAEVWAMLHRLAEGM